LRRIASRGTIRTMFRRSRAGPRDGLALDAVPYAALDVETTGFSPRMGDRVVEIAVVRMAPDGTIQDEFATLVDPERDVGPTRVHGIRASDLVGAPRFADIVGDVAERMGEAVLVAHNARFDLSFLRAEFDRAGFDLPAWPTLCTLRLAYERSSLPRRRLADCCEALGVALPQAHTALDDARAAAQVLLCFLRGAREQGLRDLRALGCEPATFPAVPWPPIAPSGRSLPRGSSTALEGEPSYLARLVERLSPIDTGDADLAAYLELLDRVLEDRRVTEDEAEALLASAEEWGLDRDDAERAHHRYLLALCEAALVDGRVSATEREDLETVRRLLGLGEDALEEALAAAASGGGAASVPIERLVGMTVCFTGTLEGRLQGEPITREQAHELAEEAGLVVRDRVTKDLDILVVADPYTKSGKAQAARRYGIRIMTEAAFWRAIGAQVE
jgi:DNA polymerase-3 subunit epsilon